MEKETIRRNNAEFLFLPFKIDKENFKSTINILNNSSIWKPYTDGEFDYIYKYVSEKFNTKNPDFCLGYHYLLNDDINEKINQDMKGTFENNLPFSIRNIHLFFFRTGVGIISFRILFPETVDAKSISTELFYMKNVYKFTFGFMDKDNAIPFIGLESNNAETTFLKLADRYVDELRQFSPEFFYYQNEEKSRANALIYIEDSEHDDAAEELFYLRNCYSSAYTYSEEFDNRYELYRLQPTNQWGVTSEATACVFLSKFDYTNFAEIFYKNFLNKYWFVYVILLHQKYALYMFLDKIGVGMYNDLETLEKYEKELYEFETDFVFAHITEVPQYKKFYDCHLQSFVIQSMLDDIRVPVISLNEVREKELEKKENSRDKKINILLSALAILSVISVINDLCSLAEMFYNNSGMLLGRIQFILGFSILIIFVTVLLFINKKRKNKNEKKD